MNLYTIGFAGKSAESFFSLLVEHNVSMLVDIRLNNKSQLAGFANAKHLPYFLRLHGIGYNYQVELAPTKELLDGYKKKMISWNTYEKQYKKLIEKRNIINSLDIGFFENSVLLCSENAADHCHRRLLAELLAEHFNNITIMHL